MFVWDSDPKPVLDELRMYPNVVSRRSIQECIDYLLGLEKEKRFALVVGNCADPFLLESPELWGKTVPQYPNGIPHFVRNVDPLSVMIDCITSVRDTVYYADKDRKFGLFLRYSNFFKPRSDSGRVFRGMGVNRPDDLTYDPQRMLTAYHETAMRVRKTQDWEEEGEHRNVRVWHASEWLQEDYERAVSNKVGYDMWQSGTHLRWIGARSAKVSNFTEINLPSEHYQPFALKIDSTISLFCLAYVMAALESKGWKRPLILVSRLGVDNMHKLPVLMEHAATVAERFDFHKVLWMVDPQHGNTIKMGGKKVRPLSHVKSEMLHFLETCDTMRVHPAGMWLEANFTESCHEENDPDSLCDPRLSQERTEQLVRCWTEEFGKIMEKRLPCRS